MHGIYDLSLPFAPLSLLVSDYFMNIQPITALGGTITLDNLISLITDELKEDLLQASFRLGQILDIGWYPEFSEQGAFRVSLISNRNWESPIYCETAKTWTDLYQAITNALHEMKRQQPKT
jgi:hypothetical protein